MKRSAEVTDVGKLASLIADLTRRVRQVEKVSHVHRGGYTTAGRPNASLLGVGTQIYDTTLHRPVWSDGTVWRDSTGTAV